MEELSAHLDYICPMVYPSGYHLGIPGVRNPVTTRTRSSRRACGSPASAPSYPAVQVRPWLQDFRDYAFDKRIFGSGRDQRPDPRRQRRRAPSGWMLWNPKNDYTAAALPPKTAAHDESRPR